MTRNELRTAFLKAGITGRERYVYLALLDHCDIKTCEIPDQFQPFGHHSVQYWGVSRRTVQRALPHLYEHGWLSYLPWGDRPRPDPGKQPRTDRRRGRPRNWYKLHPGRPCDCPKHRTTDRSSDGKTIAIAKQADNKLLRIDTTTGEVTAHQDDALSTSNKAPEVHPNKAPEVYAIERQTSLVSAGQTPNRHEGLRWRGKGGWGVVSGRDTGPRPLPDWEPGTIGWEMNRPSHETLRRAA